MVKSSSAQLDRQKRLVSYLADPDAYLSTDLHLGVDEAIRGMDKIGLRIMGKVALRKRRSKIGSILVKTFEVIGDDLDAVLNDFSRRKLPVDLSRESNATQFYEYLLSAPEGSSDLPEYLADLALFEINCWQAILASENNLEIYHSGDAKKASPEMFDNMKIGRQPDVRLVELEYDIRSLLDDKGASDEPAQKHIQLVILGRRENSPLRVFEIEEHLFGLLGDIEEAATLKSLKDQGHDYNAKDLNELWQSGVIEIEK
jgi:hypothetical protein